MDSNSCKKDSILFKELSSTSEKGNKPNLNPLYNDSNPGIWRSEEHNKDLNPCKKDLNPIYKMKLLAEDQAKRFKSPLAMNSNFAPEIQIPLSANVFNA